MTTTKPSGWSNRTVLKGPKLIHAYEQLEAIDKATGEEKEFLLKTYAPKAPLNYILSLNFNDKVRLGLPEGMPPLNPKEMDSITHPDMMGNLSSSIHRLKNCMIENRAMPQTKKEEIFIQVLLACPLKDAEIVCSAKDKALTELYPSITKEFVKSVFPSLTGE